MVQKGLTLYIPPQKLRKLGIAANEQAVLFLMNNIAEDTPMATYSIVPRAAKMKRVNLVRLHIFKGSVHKWSAQDLQRCDLPAFFGPAIAGEGRQLTRSLT